MKRENCVSESECLRKADGRLRNLEAVAAVDSGERREEAVDSVRLLDRCPEKRPRDAGTPGHISAKKKDKK